MPFAPPASVALLDAAAARAGDEAAVEAGDTWAGLMERAAGHLARGVVAAAGHGYGLRVAVVVGKGNNGGDGWAAARRLARLGAQAWVVGVHGIDVEVSAEAQANRTAWLRSAGRTSSGPDGLEAALEWCDVAVDALLGTGISGDLRGDVGDATRVLNAARERRGIPVVACDIPSGVSSDDGSAGEGAVTADLTVTFGALKRGLLLHPGAAHAGRVVVGSLGPRYRPPADAWQALTPRGVVPDRLPWDADKRARGRILVVAGAVGTSGAAALTAQGALVAGAGLVTVATPAPVRAEVAAHHPAAMVHPLPAGDDGALSPEAAEALPPLDRFDVVVAGPGLGHGDGTAAVVAHLRRHAPRLVLDADGLNVHRDDPTSLGKHDGALVVTPHERELARIGGGSDGADAWAHRVERVPKLAADLGAVIVAKGPGTIVAAPDGRVWVSPPGGPALGSGGTGDVLSGILAAAIGASPGAAHIGASPGAAATGASPGVDDLALAVARAVWWHGAAGQRAGRDRADRATAVDLLHHLPGVLGDLAATSAGLPPSGGLPWEAWRDGGAS